MRLIEVDGVWVAPNFITWLEPADDGGCYINFVGGDPGFVHVDLTPEQVVSRIQGETE